MRMCSTAAQICCIPSSLSDKLLTVRIKQDLEGNWTIPSQQASVLLTTAWSDTQSLCVATKKSWERCLPKSLLYCEARLIWYNRLHARVDILHLISATELQIKVEHLEGDRKTRDKSQGNS